MKKLCIDCNRRIKEIEIRKGTYKLERRNGSGNDIIFYLLHLGEISLILLTKKGLHSKNLYSQFAQLYFKEGSSNNKVGVLIYVPLVHKNVNKFDILLFYLYQ